MCMTLMLELFAALSLLELVLMSRWTRPVRRPLAAGLAVATALLSGGIFGSRPSLATGLFAVVSLYRVINLLRLVKDRSEEHYLLKSARRTTLSLSLVQVFVLLCLAAADQTQPDSSNWWSVLALVQLVVAIGLYALTARQLHTTAPLEVSEHFSDAHLPSVSVCIPARNETAALEECLRSLVASDYPKLEILVLDDCSQGGRTSDIIRSYAHDGVRFLQGDVPPKDWLAKNWAYQQLYESASGELIVFCGVDVNFDSSALRGMVTTLLAKQKRMLSLIPRNVLPDQGTAMASILIQPARYAWEICPPRRAFKRPPTLSSCWIAERKLIDRSGSFRAVRNMIVPEAYFARKAIARDGYSFTQSSADGVVSDKSRQEQWATAVRTRYPQLGRRLDMVLFVTVLELALIISPPLVAILGVARELWPQALAAGIATALICAVYGRIVALTYRKQLPIGYLLAPFATLLDVYLRHESAWRYEFGDVEWKGRNVCLPVMRVIPKLPKV